MSVRRKKGSSYYWYDFRFRGERHRGSTKQTGITKAKNVEDELKRKLRNGETMHLRSGALYLRDFAPHFLKFVRDARLAEKTKQYYMDGWRLLASQDIAKMRIDHITTSTAATVQAPGSLSNVNCALRTLRRMLHIAKEQQLIASVPKIHMEKEVQRERLVAPNEELLVLAKANPSVHDAFILQMDLGVRPSEAACLAWAEVEFHTNRILISSGKTAKSRRWLVMTTRVKEMLVERARKGGQWVFPSVRNDGGHIKPRSLVNMFCDLKRKLGLPKDLVQYSARHTFGTDFQAAQGDLVMTSRTLGHAGTAITGRYVHPDTASQQGLMDARNAKRQEVVYGEGRVN